MKRCLLLASLLLFACDTAGETERTYTVTYAVAGTFERCSVTFNNRDDDIEQRSTALPWSTSFDVTVGESGFYAAAAATCDAAESRSAEVSVTVDDRLVEEEAETGTSVSIDADAWLHLEGVEADMGF